MRKSQPPRPPRPSGPRWRKLKAEVRARRGRCCRCGQPIDYRLEWPDPDSFSVDHYPRPLSTHPHLAEDPGNLKPAHLRCNQAAGDRGPVPSLGQPSEDW
jgi:5-methylcytosine-specific restriction endonuclease McrA